MQIKQLKRALEHVPDDSKPIIVLEGTEYRIRRVLVDYDNLNKVSVKIEVYEDEEPYVETIYIDDQLASISVEDRSLFQTSKVPVEGPETVGECRRWLEEQGHYGIEPGTELERPDGRFIVWDM